jgi:hypothetical protein
VDQRRPPPPVTVIVPGRSNRACEVLAQADDGAEPVQAGPRRPGRRAGAVLLLAGLLLVGASVSVEQPDPPAPEVAPDPLAAVGASSQLLTQDELRVRLLVEVRIAVPPPAAGLAGTRPASAQVLLEGLSSPGLVVRLPGRPLPVPLGYLGRTDTGSDASTDTATGTVFEQVVRLTVDAVALGCVEPQRPRRLALQVSRGPRGSGVGSTVAVRDRAEVVEALEGLVRRSCGRPGR